jgi:predicted dienelactone hydrolase
MSKHTPGPWHHVICEGTSRIMSESGPDNQVFVCGMSFGDDTTLETLEANAKLIARAPKLLDACERAEFILRRISEGDHRALQNSVDCARELRETLEGLVELEGLDRDNETPNPES